MSESNQQTILNALAEIQHAAEWFDGEGYQRMASAMHKAYHDLDGLVEQVQTLEREKVELELACDNHRMFWQKAEKRERGLQEQFDSVLSLAEHLFQMIPREVWRDQGGDDQQGHYEGDYYAEQTEQKLVALRASFPAMRPSDG